MRARHFILLVVLIATAFGWALACTGEDVLTTFPPPTADALPPTDEAGLPLTCEEARCPRDCSVIYVSVVGKVDHDGCSPEKPLPTIAAGLGAAKRPDGKAKEVRVCQGVYEESPLTLDMPISLLGGLSCGGWVTHPTYVWPKLDANPFESVIRNGGFAQSPITLTVTAGAGSAKVEGFTIVGGPVTGSGNTAATALLIAAGATPAVAQNLILGGSATSDTSNATVGLHIDKSGGDIHHNLVRGGSGTATNAADAGTAAAAFGSGALIVTGNATSAPYVHDNVFEGGTGTCGVGATCKGSVGVYIAGDSLARAVMTSAANRAFERNTVRGGSGISEGSNGYGSVGLVVESGIDIDVVGCVIQAGDGKADRPDQTAASATVLKRTDGPVQIAKSRIIGATSKTPSTTTTTIDVVGPGGGSFSLINNFITGGAPLPNAGAPKTSRLLHVTTATRLAVIGVVRHNTFHAGQGVAVHIAVREDGPSAALSMTVDNNIFVGRVSEDDVGVVSNFCVGNPFASFTGNTFVGIRSLFSKFKQLDGGGSDPDVDAGVVCKTTTTTVNDLEKEMGVASLNSRVSTGCDGELPEVCRLCVDQLLGCGKDVFDPWVNPASEVLDVGFRLKKSAPCTIVKGAAPIVGVSDGAGGLLGVVNDDIFNTPRTPGASRGAHEQLDDGCVPP